MRISTIARSTFVLALTALIISACATKPTAVWQEPSFTGSVDNILIIGVSESDSSRRLFEDTFVRDLSALQINSISSYKILPEVKNLTRENIESAIDGEKIDAVLVTQLLGIEDAEVYHPPVYYPYSRSYYGYYSHSMARAAPGYYAKYRIFKLETSLYDTATQKLIWSMQSDSIDHSTPQNATEKQIKLTIDTLAKHKLIVAKP